jgi:hypothetical protein
MKTLPHRRQVNDPDIEIAGSIRRSTDNCSRCNNANGLESLQDERHGFTQSPIIFMRQFWKITRGFHAGIQIHVSLHDE